MAFSTLEASERSDINSILISYKLRRVWIVIHTDQAICTQKNDIARLQFFHSCFQPFGDTHIAGFIGQVFHQQ